MGQMAGEHEAGGEDVTGGAHQNAETVTVETLPVPELSDGRDGPDGAPTLKDTRPSGIARLLPRTRQGRQRLRAGIALALVAVVLFVSIQGALAAVDAVSAGQDARTHIAALEGTLNGRMPRDLTALPPIREHLAALRRDVQRIEADLPVPGLLGALPASGSAVHGLRMADYLTGAGVAALDAAILAGPHVLGGIRRLENKIGTQAGGPDTQPLTPAQATQTQTYLRTALNLFTAGMRERQYVSNADLERLRIGRLDRAMRVLDQAAALVLPYEADLQTILDALPDLLGIGRTVNYLVLNLDSDELRPTGGFQGNYTVLTLVGGQITGGIQTHDIYLADATIQGKSPTPARFAWFKLAQNSFGIRDANLDPDYPATARLNEEMFAKQTGTKVDGVISITPAFIERILRITGPLDLGLLNTKVTADNLRDTIHYAHFLGTYNPWAFLGVGSSIGTSDRKVADAVLGVLLARSLARASLDQLIAIGREVMPALESREVSIYVNNARAQGILKARGLDGAVVTPRGDSMFVVDTNAGGSYANSDIDQRVRDRVTLAADGTATHDVTITYNYRYIRHNYDAILEYYDKTLNFYTDVVRVLVPPQARVGGVSGCGRTTTTQPNRAVIACQFTVLRGRTQTIHFTWSVPRAVTGNTYTLYIQRQPSTRIQYEVSVTPPPGKKLTAAAPWTSTSTGATFTARPTRDVALDLRIT